MKAAAVTFDIGGVIYSDDVFKRAIFIALNKLSNGVTQDEFDQVYNAHLKTQSGLSNKQWDKGIKGLTKNNIAKVTKTDDNLIVDLV